jgi:C4-dicarboxylate transporter DctQ subunit
LNRWNRAFSRFEEWASGSLVVIGLGLILYGVFMRYVINSPQAWVEEISKYLVVWGVLLGGSLALRNKHHITVDLVYFKLNGIGQKAVNIFANTVGLIFCIVYFNLSYQLVAKYLSSGQVSIDVGVPLWIVYMIMPISATMLGIRVIQNLVAALKAEAVQERGDENDAPIV